MSTIYPMHDRGCIWVQRECLSGYNLSVCMPHATHGQRSADPCITHSSLTIAVTLAMRGYRYALLSLCVMRMDMDTYYLIDTYKKLPNACHDMGCSQSAYSRSFHFVKPCS